MDTKEQILQVARRLVQQRGFNGFSYADIASEVGIRKASLHHHFPTKAELGLALIDAYSADFNKALEQIDNQSLPATACLEAYVGLYRGTLESERICLGGMLATEAPTLDSAMLPRIAHFFARNAEWLEKVLTEGQNQDLFDFKGTPSDQARVLLSALQGASVICRSTGDLDAFNQVASMLIAGLAKGKV